MKYSIVLLTGLLVGGFSGVQADEVDDLKAQIEQQMQELEKLKGTIKESSDELESVKGKISESDGKIAGITDKIDELCDQLTEAAGDAAENAVCQ